LCRGWHELPQPAQAQVPVEWPEALEQLLVRNSNRGWRRYELTLLSRRGCKAWR